MEFKLEPDEQPEDMSAPKAEAVEAENLQQRALGWARRRWRPVGTTIAVGLALLVTWHVVYGRHGVSVWWQMRAQDRVLQQQINDLQHENDAMREQIGRLQSDPKAIEREAREKLHYAKPGEKIIYSTAQPQTPQQTNQ
jgi:cell division protein FtsB